MKVMVINSYKSINNPQKVKKKLKPVISYINPTIMRDNQFNLYFYFFKLTL